MNIRPYFPYLLIFTAIAGAIEIDLALPSFPDMAKAFGVEEAVVAATISLNFLGFCLSALLYGPLADRFGRRPVLVVGTGVFLLGSLGCAMATSMNQVLAFRLLQGLGAAASWVIIFTMIADVYEGDEAVGWIGRLNAIITAVMAGAPIAGSILNAYTGWRGCYAFIAAWSLGSFVLLYFYLPETRAGQRISARKVVDDYRSLLTSNRFMVASLVPTLLAGAYMSFVAVIPFLYQDALGMPLWEYAIHQALIIGSFSLMSYLANRIAARYGEARAAMTGLWITVAATLSLLVLSMIWVIPPVFLVTTLMCLFAATCAISFAVVFAMSLSLFPSQNGPASSLLMSMRTLLCAATIQLSGALYTGALYPAALIVATCCTISLPLAGWLYASRARQIAQ